MKIIHKYPYCIGHSAPLSQKDISALLNLFSENFLEEPGVLGGRGNTEKVTLENNLNIVVKRYKRGGLLRHFVRDSYLRTGKTRPRIEFEMLCKAEACGISTPEPVAWACCGGLIYRGLLATKEIENSTTLADHCLSQPDDFDDALLMTVEQVLRMIKNNIMHVDLHPGNILFDGDRVYVIDFDKSATTNKSAEKLAGFYIKRWKRAVKKHRLPPEAAALFEENLRKGISR